MQATHDGDMHPLPCNKTLSMAEILEINNPAILIRSELADSTIGKNVIIGEPRERKQVAQQQQSGVHLLGPATATAVRSPAHLIHQSIRRPPRELEKAKRCLASDPASANILVAGSLHPSQLGICLCLRLSDASQIFLRVSNLPGGRR